MSESRDKILKDINNLNEDVYYLLLNKRDITTMDIDDLVNIREKVKRKTVITEKMQIEDDVTQGGCKSEFFNQYNRLLMQDIDEVLGSVTIKGKKVNFDIALVRVMKALLLVGVTPNEELAEICRVIVNKIAVLGTSISHVTVKSAVERLSQEKKAEGIANTMNNSVLEVLKKCMDQ